MLVYTTDRVNRLAKFGVHLLRHAVFIGSVLKMQNSPAQFQRVKSHIVTGIEDGTWASGDRIPSENELSEQFSLSRMTVNRAIRELAAEGVLDRIQGKGTFVAQRGTLSSVLEIGDIAEEIRGRGNVYTSRVVSNRMTTVSANLAKRISLPMRSAIARSIVVHSESGVPIQVEQRWVNPDIAPEYCEQQFAEMTPSAYLTQIAPLTRGEHAIEACIADRNMQRWLDLSENEACLRIHRWTWVGATLASYSQLVHPGSRYMLRSNVVPSSRS